MCFLMDQLQPLMPKESRAPLYRYYHQVENGVKGNVYYSQELRVRIHLENVVKDVIRSCNYDLKTDTEAALNGLKVDSGIIRKHNDSICGTMEVKQPQRPRPDDPPKGCNADLVSDDVTSHHVRCSECSRDSLSRFLLAFPYRDTRRRGYK